MPTRLEKCNDAIQYIQQSVPGPLAVELSQRITVVENGADLPAIDSTSTSGAGFRLGAPRRALRALLLCQRQLNPLLRTAQQRSDAGWPGVTIDYWKLRSEADLIAALRLYAPLPSPDSVAAAAAVNPPGLFDDHSWTRAARGLRPFPINKMSCYAAVQWWLLQSGHVSIRWIWEAESRLAQQSNQPNNAQPLSLGQKLLCIFGNGSNVYNVTNVRDNLAVQQIVNSIPRDRVIYMYKSDGAGTPIAVGAGGHWMVTSGNGMAYGRNNASADGANPDYAHCRIASQINEQVIRANNSVVYPVYLRVYDPAAIGD